MGVAGADESLVTPDDHKCLNVGLGGRLEGSLDGGKEFKRPQSWDPQVILPPRASASNVMVATSGGCARNCPIVGGSASATFVN